MKTKVNLKIAGSSYTVSATETEEYIYRVGGHVDKLITDLLESNPHFSTAQAAVLSAINLCDECFKAQSAADNLRSQIKTYLEDASKYRSELEESKKEIARLNQEIQNLKIQLARAEGLQR